MRVLFSLLASFALLPLGFADTALKKPAPTPEVRALFFHSGGLVPLVCYDTKTKKVIKKDTDCFKKLPDDTGIFLSGDTPATIKGTSTGYVSGVIEVMALGFSPQPKTSDWFAPIAYPSASSLSLVKFDDLSKTSPLTKDEQTAFEKLLKPKKGQSISLHHRASADLDGDGKEDSLYSVNIPEAEGSYHWSGIIVAKGGDLSKPFVAYSYPKTLGFAEQRAWFSASFDLEGDGKRELVAVHAYLADYEQVCLRLNGKKLVSVPISHSIKK